MTNINNILDEIEEEAIIEKAKLDLEAKEGEEKKKVVDLMNSLSDLHKAIKDIPKPEKVDFKVITDLLSGISKNVSNQEVNIDLDSIVREIKGIDIPKIKLERIEDTLAKILNKKIEIDFPAYPDYPEFPEEVNLSEDTLDKLSTKIKEAVSKIKGVGTGIGGGGIGINKIKDKADKIINPSTKEKQDEIVSAINSISIEGATNYATNEIYENSSDTYFCKESATGIWYIKKIDVNSIFSHATIKNNAAISDYTDARTNVLTLTYENYDKAF